jgi:hypothetical protein
LSNAIAGLVPAIHRDAKKMAPRVKAAVTGKGIGSTSSENAPLALDCTKSIATAFLEAKALHPPI